MEEMIHFFSKYKAVSIMMHVFSVIVGMGTAIVSDILFNVYIKDKKINPTENKTLEVLSRIIWVSLGFIVLSGLAIFLSDPLKYAISTKFLVKMIIVLVIIINGYLFWKVTHKALKKINFTDTNSHHKYVRVRRASFAFGAVSVVSWFFAFIIGSIPSMSFSLREALGVYISAIVFAIIGSQILEYKITH